MLRPWVGRRFRRRRDYRVVAHDCRGESGQAPGRHLPRLRDRRRRPNRIARVQHLRSCGRVFGGWRFRSGARSRRGVRDPAGSAREQRRTNTDHGLLAGSPRSTRATRPGAAMNAAAACASISVACGGLETAQGPDPRSVTSAPSSVSRAMSRKRQERGHSTLQWPAMSEPAARRNGGAQASRMVGRARIECERSEFSCGQPKAVKRASCLRLVQQESANQSKKRVRQRNERQDRTARNCGGRS